MTWRRGALLAEVARGVYRLDAFGRPTSFHVPARALATNGQILHLLQVSLSAETATSDGRGGRTPAIFALQ